MAEDGKSKIINHIERFGGWGCGGSKAMIMWYNVVGFTNTFKHLKGTAKPWSYGTM
jgi:hypothetical protein